MGKRTCDQPTVDGGRCRNGPGCTIDHKGQMAAFQAGANTAAAAAGPGDDPFPPFPEDLEEPQGLFGDDGTPPEILAVLADDPDPDVRRSVADNPNTPPGALTVLADDPDPDVRAAAASNPSTPPDKEATARRIADQLRGAEPAKRRGVAANSGTRPGTLAALADDPDKDVRWAVATNPNTPAETLARLADDPDMWCDVAENPACPPEVLMALAASAADHDDDHYAWFVQKLVAPHPNTTPETLAALVADTPDPDVRRPVAENPNTTPATLTALAADPDYLVRYAVAENPNTSPDTLTALAADPDYEVRAAALGNPATPAAGQAAAGRLAD